ncbi:hypothetical protein ACLMJK_005337 [Lecanora helva]
MSWSFLVPVRNASFGEHLPQPPGPVEVKILTIWFKYLYVFTLTWALAQMLNKISMALFLYRIYPVVQFRRFLKYATVFIIAAAIAWIFVDIFQCYPVDSFWNTLAGQNPRAQGGHCIDSFLYYMISGAVNTVEDFILLVLPIPMVWRLDASKNRKLVLTAIFLIGLTVCAVSIIRLTAFSRLVHADLTWTYVTPALWTSAESSVTVVGACLPSIRPLVARGIRARHAAKIGSQSSHVSLASSWRNGKGKDSFDGGFNKLPDVSGGTWGWSNSMAVDVRGGHDPESEEYEIGATSLPAKGIMVKTEVIQTIHERLNYHDELF